jgi:DUF1009 family protein
MDRPMNDSLPPIGIIAGQGRLPVHIAEGIRAAGRRVACVGFAGMYDDDLPQYCDLFAKSAVLRPGRWIYLLRRWRVREAVLIGRVNKSKVMYDPLRAVRQFPDWRLAKLWYRTLRHDKRPTRVLTALADELAGEGIELIDSTRYIPQLLADVGVLTRRQPTREQLSDIDFGWPIVKQLNRMDIGQSVAIKEREIIAVEAIEGTNELIRRAGTHCRVGGWTLIKTAKANHDMRLDVPTVGPTTLELMHEHGGTCMVLECGKVILAEKPRFLELADKLKIAVIGHRAEED